MARIGEDLRVKPDRRPIWWDERPPTTRSAWRGWQARCSSGGRPSTHNGSRWWSSLWTCARRWRTSRTVYSFSNPWL